MHNARQAANAAEPCLYPNSAPPDVFEPAGDTVDRLAQAYAYANAMQSHWHGAEPPQLHDFGPEIDLPATLTQPAAPFNEITAANQNDQAGEPGFWLEYAVGLAIALMLGVSAAAFVMGSASGDRTAPDQLPAAARATELPAPSARPAVDTGAQLAARSEAAKHSVPEAGTVKAPKVHRLQFVPVDARIDYASLAMPVVAVIASTASDTTASDTAAADAPRSEVRVSAAVVPLPIQNPLLAPAARAAAFRKLMRERAAARLAARRAIAALAARQKRDAATRGIDRRPGSGPRRGDAVAASRSSVVTRAQRQGLLTVQRRPVFVPKLVPELATPWPKWGQRAMRTDN